MGSVDRDDPHPLSDTPLPARSSATMMAGMPKPDLEAQLTALTHEFVGRLVQAIRNASFAEVAALPAKRQAPTVPRPKGEGTARVGGAKQGGHNGASTRQTAARRAEVGERVVRALRSAGEPLGVRALSTDLGVRPDILATPLRELRSAGRIKKHGEKRSTTYSLE
jgi:hypothetical protein